MKFGMRKPSIKKSIKARTTGKAKRKVKKALIPGYGKKGIGYIKNPKKLFIIKSTKRQLFLFGIYLNKNIRSIYGNFKKT